MSNLGYEALQFQTWASKVSEKYSSQGFKSYIPNGKYVFRYQFTVITDANVVTEVE